MATGYPDFTKPISFRIQEIPSQTKREWIATEIENKMLNLSLVTNPGYGNQITFYTVPSGKKFYVSDIVLRSLVNAYGEIWYTGQNAFFYIAIPRFSTQQWSFSVPYPITAGNSITWWMYNQDLRSTTYHMIFQGWEEPGSEPEKPKSDDPEELYRCGEFNYCQVIPLINGEQVFIFRKAREEIWHYLRVKDYSKPSQKVLAQFHLKPEEAQEVLDTRRVEPEKLIETLKKYEEKYGRKKLFGITI
jgi:hypothetical protein